MKECEYHIKIIIDISHLSPAKTTEEQIEREQLQNHLNFLANTWASNQKNQQNLMNIILGNTGILIP